MKFALSRKNLWDKTPPLGKRVIGSVLGRIPPSFLLGGTFRRNLATVRASERWTKAETERFQVARLREVLSVAARAPFYRDLFATHGLNPSLFANLADLRRLPLMDRETVQNNLEGMATGPTSASNVDYVTTGGTTGAPLRFYATSDRHTIEFAFIVAGWERTGYRLGDTLYVLRGRKVPFDPAAKMHHEYESLLRHHYYSNFDTSAESFNAYVAHMVAHGPGFLHAYPSSAFALARHIRSQALKPPLIKAVLLESENVYPDQRTLIEEVFGARCFSGYGHTEKLVAAAECEHSSDYHVWPKYGYCEVLDDHGEPLREGARGEIVGTGFMNTLVPFIRYRTGDFATLVGDHCEKCGRQQMVLREIRGHRIQESVVLDDGSLVSWTALNMHDDTFDHVSRVQFVQERAGEAALRVVVDPGFGSEDETRILRNLEAKLQGRLRIRILRVPTIELSNSGKVIYVDQRIPGVSAGET